MPSLRSSSPCPVGHLCPGGRTGQYYRLAPPVAPRRRLPATVTDFGCGQSLFDLRGLRLRRGVSLSRSDQAMQAVKDQNQRSQYAFDLRRRGAKEIRTPDLLHAIQIQTIARCGWMWPCQQLQSLHVARDSPVLPLACSPSCSPAGYSSPSRQHPTAPIWRTPRAEDPHDQRRHAPR
jgi:hypothetical protein